VATSGQTLVIGGLIKESKGVTNTSVPVLGKIPLIGGLFRSKNNGSERTELVVLITPHIIHSAQRADVLRDQLFDRFSHLKWETD
jgi:general secretion pathway protein D